MSANDHQYGGNHYQKPETQEQHWDRAWREDGPAYHKWQAIKYIERYRDKHPITQGELCILDLQKAKHFIEKLIELETAAMQGTGVLPGGGHQPLKSNKVVAPVHSLPEDDT